MVLLFDVSAIQETADALLEYSYPPVDITPIILTPNHSPRNVQKDAIQTMLRDVTETRSTVLLAQKSLAQLETSVRLREAALKSALSPVSGLPTEVLRDMFLRVFELEQQEFDVKACKSNIYISHVCARWRTIALGIQTLWEPVHVTSRSPGLFEHFARRSGSLPLKVVLHGVERGPLVITEAAASRITHLELCRYQHKDVMSALEKVASSLRLQSLSLTNAHGLADYIRDKNGSGPVFTLNKGLTSAKDLAVDSCSVINPSRLRMKRLRNLHIRHVDNTDVSDILHALSKSSVKSITLEDISAEDDMPGELAVTDASGLEAKITSLDLSYCDGKVFAWICAEWKMSSLTTLTLTQPVVLPNQAEQYEELLRDFFVGAPNVSSLCIDVDAQLYYPLSRLLGDAKLLPKLTRLNIGFEDGMPDADGEDWGEMKSILEIVEARRRRHKTSNLVDISVPKWFMKNRDDDLRTLRGLVDKLELWSDDDSDDDLDDMTDSSSEASEL